MGTVETSPAKTLGDDAVVTELEKADQAVVTEVGKTEDAVVTEVGKTEDAVVTEVGKAEDAVVTEAEKVEDVNVVPTTVVENEVGVVHVNVANIESVGGLNDVMVEDGNLVGSVFVGDGEKGSEDDDGRGVLVVKDNVGEAGNWDGSVLVDQNRDGIKASEDGDGRGVLAVEDNVGEGGNVTGVEEGIEKGVIGESGDKGYDYEVGDFVWVKLNNREWWPGMVYDEHDASDIALKKKTSNPLLVGLFGDGTFSWCNKYELMPFLETLEFFSKRNQSPNSVNALRDTLTVFARLADLEFDRSLPEEKRRGLDRPLVNNKGIKEDVLMPTGGIRRITSLFGYQSSILLEKMKVLATYPSAVNMIDLTVLKSLLSAFYHAKGGYHLASYIAPRPILGLEDISEGGGIVGTPAMGPPIEVADTSDGNSAQQKKQKSISDILRNNIGVQASKTPSTGKRKRKASDVSDVQNVTSFSSKTKRRKSVLGKALNVDSDAGVGEKDQATDQSKQESDDGSLTAKKTMIRVLNVQSEDGGEHTGKGTHSREKKKSKYLSPPYTTFGQSQMKKALHTESIGITSREKMIEADSGIMKNSNTLTPAQNERTINPTNIQVSAKEVLSGILSAACNPTGIENNEALSAIKGYVSAFRNSVFSDESKETAQKSQAPDAETDKGTEIVQANPKDREASSLHFDVKEKLDLISSIVETLTSENALELRPKLEAEIRDIKEWVAALSAPPS